MHASDAVSLRANAPHTAACRSSLSGTLYAGQSRGFASPARASAVLCVLALVACRGSGEGSGEQTGDFAAPRRDVTPRRSSVGETFDWEGELRRRERVALPEWFTALYPWTPEPVWIRRLPELESPRAAWAEDEMADWMWWYCGREVRNAFDRARVATLVLRLVERRTPPHEEAIHDLRGAHIDAMTGWTRAISEVRMTARRAIAGSWPPQAEVEQRRQHVRRYVDAHDDVPYRTYPEAEDGARLGRAGRTLRMALWLLDMLEAGPAGDAEEGFAEPARDVASERIDEESADDDDPDRMDAAMRELATAARTVCTHVEPE